MASGVYSNPVLAVTPRGYSPLVILALLRLPVGLADSRFQRLSSAFGYPLGLSASALKSFAFSAVTRHESPAIKSASFPMALLHDFLDRHPLLRKRWYCTIFSDACERAVSQHGQRRFGIAKIKRLDIPLHRLDVHLGGRLRHRCFRHRQCRLPLANRNHNRHHNQQRSSAGHYYHSFCHLVARFTKPHRKIRMKFTVACLTMPRLIFLSI